MKTLEIMDQEALPETDVQQELTYEAYYNTKSGQVLVYYLIGGEAVTDMIFDVQPEDVKVVKSSNGDSYLEFTQEGDVHTFPLLGIEDR